MGKYASMNPVDFVTGGLLDDVTVTFKNVKYEMCDYNGTVDPTPSLAADLVVAGEEKTQRQHWSCGSAEMWEPSPDGKGCVAVGRDQCFRKNSNVGFFLSSLAKAGFNMELLNDGDCTVLEGMEAHIKRMEPEGGRPGIDRPQTRRGRDGKEYAVDKRIPVVVKLIHVPSMDSKATAGKKGKTVVEPDGGTSGAGAPDLDSQAIEVLLKLITEGGGKTTTKDLPNKGFAAVPATNKDKNKIVALLFRTDWVKSHGFNVSETGEITIA